MPLWKVWEDQVWESSDKTMFCLPPWLPLSSTLLLLFLSPLCWIMKWPLSHHNQQCPTLRISPHTYICNKILRVWRERLALRRYRRFERKYRLLLQGWSLSLGRKPVAANRMLSSLRTAQRCSYSPLWECKMQQNPDVLICNYSKGEIFEGK
jgi:hypothetical protein